jgi:hypothetical protein
VSGTTDHPLDLDEQVTEDFLVAGRRGRVVWTVVVGEAPERWVIAGEENRVLMRSSATTARRSVWTSSTGSRRRSRRPGPCYRVQTAIRTEAVAAALAAARASS